MGHDYETMKHRVREEEGRSKKLRTLNRKLKSDKENRVMAQTGELANLGNLIQKSYTKIGRAKRDGASLTRSLSSPRGGLGQSMSCSALKVASQYLTN